MVRIGLDIGSTAAKVAVLDEKSQLIDTLLAPTGFNSAETARAIERTLAERGFSPQDNPVVATGYGRVSVPFATKTVTEITCHGKGAWYLFGADGTVIDVGGQDTKVIQLANGRVKKFFMNDRCAAGTGKFLEVMANRMGLTQDELSALARQGQPVEISSMCTVFAESEVISLVGKGTPREDIANGVIESIAQKVVSLAKKLPSSQYFLTGGLCENGYIVERLSARLEAPVTTMPQARYAGAIGAALCAPEEGA